MTADFNYDVFLSHSARDKAVVRDLAERLRKDGVRVWFDEWEIQPGDSIPAKIEEGLERSRVLVLCMSANAFGSDWAQLESGTFRFRDPLNKERRFLLLRLDDAPIKGSMAQFLYIDWRKKTRKSGYRRLVDACRTIRLEQPIARQWSGVTIVSREHMGFVGNATFSVDTHYVAFGYSTGEIRVWDVEKKSFFSVLMAGIADVSCVALSPDGQLTFSSYGDGSLRIWKTVDGTVVQNIKVPGDAVSCIVTTRDGQSIVVGFRSGIVRIWDVSSNRFTQELGESRSEIRCGAVSPDGLHGVFGYGDQKLRVWDFARGRCTLELAGHSGPIKCVSWNPNTREVVSGSEDRTLRIWDVANGHCTRVLEGHVNSVLSVSWSGDSRRVFSGSADENVRIWDAVSGVCLAVFKGHASSVCSVMSSNDGQNAFSAALDGTFQAWSLSESQFDETSTREQLQYTNAKVLLVGDTNAGKTGLTHRLATGEWKPSEDSTVGAWSTQWQLKNTSGKPDVDQEIWLWDFGGQADQRLIHQLYMDHTALVLLLFNADKEDVLPGLRDWQTALRRCVKEKIPHFLVAGRIDTGFKASRGKLQTFAKEQGLGYHETSARSGEGCDDLRAAMIAGISWEQMEKRTSPRIFKLIKDEILKLRDEGQVLHTFKELRELLWRRLSDEPRFADETLQTVIGLLDGPGVVKELYYGTYILLAPEWINAYAQAVIRTLRSAENDLGVLPLRSIAEGKLIYQSIGRDGVPMEMKRLPPAEERVVLGEMERQLEQRGLCLREGNKLVFPSHCGRDRPAVEKHPSVFVSYAVKGFLDDIYATLVVKLADSESFQRKELWRDAADFVTLVGDHHMGIKLTRESGSDGDISVYFGKGVTQEEQVIFANYIHAHLESTSENAQRLRHYVCPHCQTAKGNPEALMKKLVREKQNADTECDNCGERFPLWDALEKKFASDAVRAQVEQLQADDLAKLDTRRRGKLLVLEVGARVTSADQKCFEIPATEDEGLDMELEFTNDEGEGTGRRLYLQLKSGNSYLTKRKSDGAEIFTIKKQRWVEYWLRQPHPVMLVIGTFSDADERAIGKEKLEFADVRWMEISSVLKRESANGTKSVKQIEFKGERLDLSSVRRWREKVIA